MIERTKTLSAGLALVVMLAASASAHAQQKSIAGTWTMSIEGMTLSMALEQTGKKIEGTLESPHGLIRVKGEFDGRMLTLAGALEGGPHELEVSVKGALQTDGTLAGAMTTSVGDMKWTASRN